MPAVMSKPASAASHLVAVHTGTSAEWSLSGYDGSQSSYWRAPQPATVAISPTRSSPSDSSSLGYEISPAHEMVVESSIRQMSASCIACVLYASWQLSETTSIRSAHRCSFVAESSWRWTSTLYREWSDSSRQWAAVSTHLSEMSVPPQMLVPRHSSKIEMIQGRRKARASPASAVVGEV